MTRRSEEISDNACFLLCAAFGSRRKAEGERQKMRKNGRIEKKLFTALTAAGLALSLTVPASAVVVETDELGVAYVLNEDGTRDYNNVPPQDNSAYTGEPDVIRDTNSYDLGTAGPGYDPAKGAIPEGMSEERWNRLNDNVIEWDEVGDLVRYWNPTYVKYFNQANSNITEMTGSYDEFRSQMKEQIDEVDATIEEIRAAQQLINSISSDYVPMDGVLVPKNMALEMLSAALAAAETGKASIADTLDTTKRSLYYAGGSLNTGLTPLRNQMTSVVETMVISYKTLEVNRSLVAEQVALYETLYQMQANMQTQQLGTAVNTQSYANQLDTAKKTLADIDSGMAQLKKNIALQCGYSADTEITIADLPAPDGGFLNGRDPEADKKQAVEGNQEVISAGSLSSYGYSSVGMEMRALGENEARGKATAKFEGLYKELQKQVILNESSSTSVRKAELMKNSAEIKYNQGMLGRAEYEGQRMQYLSTEAAAKLNALNLHQAIQNYKWALLGIMSL